MRDRAQCPLCEGQHENAACARGGDDGGRVRRARLEVKDDDIRLHRREIDTAARCERFRDQSGIGMILAETREIFAQRAAEHAPASCQTAWLSWLTITSSPGRVNSLSAI